MGFKSGDLDGQGNTDVVVCKKVDSSTCCVRSGVVVLKNLSLCVDDWKKVRLEDLVAIPLRRLIARNKNQWRPLIVRNSAPHHNTAPTESVNFYHTVVSKTFIFSPVNTHSAISVL